MDGWIRNGRGHNCNTVACTLTAAHTLTSSLILEIQLQTQTWVTMQSPVTEIFCSMQLKMLHVVLIVHVDGGFHAMGA